MEEVTDQEKRTIAQKFKDFQLQGLISYGKYLSDQLENSSNSEIRTTYIKYIEDQIQLNNKKIAQLSE